MRESTLWFWHIIAGAVILVFLGLHMAIMHLNDILALLGTGYANTTDAATVFARSKQGFFMVTYILLLGAALYHGLYGCRTIIFELNIGKGLQKAINWLFLLGGLFLFVYGTYVAIYLYNLKEVAQ
jgi:succinate dehydrogenase hydrophobic anchor subunit